VKPLVGEGDQRGAASEAENFLSAFKVTDLLCSGVRDRLLLAAMNRPLLFVNGGQLPVPQSAGGFYLLHEMAGP